MRTAAVVVSIAVLLTSGCGSSSPDDSDPTTPQPQTEQPTPTEQPAQSAPAPATPAAPQPAQAWAMPNLVGSNLQDAQDQIQALTNDAIFLTHSHDLSGGNRHQVLDANWKVCTQNLSAGAQLTATSTIDFGVVKLDEACP